MMDIMLPPPYEIYPYFFVDSSVIQKAYKYWMTRKADCTTYIPLQDLTLVCKCSGLHVEQRVLKNTWAHLAITNTGIGRDSGAIILIACLYAV
jgi:hypothetical protein